jgi:hypothetical protein
MESIVWGIPVARVRKEERFATPVISMTALLKEGANRKFSFNKSAVAELGLVGKESFVAFGFPTDGTNDIFVKNLGTFEKDDKDAFIDVPAGAFNVAGNLSISDKRTFEFIVKLKGLNVLVENHLHLEQVEGKPYFRVSSVESDNQEAPTDSPSESIVDVEEIDPFDAATLAEPETVIEAVPEVVVEAPKKVAKTVAKPVVEAPKVEAVVEEDEWEEYVPEVEPVKNEKAVKFAIDDTEELPTAPAPETAEDDVW